MFIKNQYDFHWNEYFIAAWDDYSDGQGRYIPIGIWWML